MTLVVETANLGHKGTPVDDHVEENSALDFGLGVFGLLGLVVCLIRKSDGASINFVAFGTGFVVSTLVVVVATCAVVASTV